MPDVPGKKILWIDAYRLQIMKALQKDQFNVPDAARNARFMIRRQKPGAIRTLSAKKSL